MINNRVATAAISAPMTRSYFPPTVSTEPEWAERLQKCPNTGIGLVYRVPPKSSHRAATEAHLNLTMDKFERSQSAPNTPMPSPSLSERTIEFNYETHTKWSKLKRWLSL